MRDRPVLRPSPMHDSPDGPAGAAPPASDAGPPDPSTQDLHAKLRQGDVSGAFAAAGEALLDDPDYYLNHLRAGYVAAAAGDAAGAARSCAWAVELSPALGWLDGDALRSEALRPRFAGTLERAPDITGKRLLEGGRRLSCGLRQGTPERPLVTIVTAVYDNHDTFERCIESVRAQTYGNVEFVVIDGGSPAQTREILERNADAIDYCVSEPDGGIYAAMNKGIQLAHGAYICLLNSDDFYEPQFVEKCVALAQSSKADIVYTDYHHGETRLSAQPIGPGVLLGHLNICHNTFLASRFAYDVVGPYREDLRIVSDAIWIRRAYRAGLSFARLSEPLFTLSEGGLSAGGTEARRRLFIDEVVRSYREAFPALTPDEAEELYLFRFNKGRSAAVLEIAKSHREDELFREALAKYVAFCFATRPGFALRHDEADGAFPIMAALARETGASAKSLRIETRHGPFPALLDAIDTLVGRRKRGARRTVLHFLTVFSAPSETFIYDLIRDLQDDPDCDNFVLFEHAKLTSERPFEKCWHVPWNDFRPEVARELYRYFLDRLSPDLVVAHFAINAHRLHERIADLGLRYPTIVMTHGIDVFTLKQETPYTAYVRDELAKRADVSFTAVSRYLKRELVAAGVAAEKIALVPNSVSTRFAATRKCTGFWRGDRPLELLAIGRLIEWKGHDLLLEAVAAARERLGADLRLTLVYGNGNERLREIETQIDDLGLAEAVRLLPFVDLNAQPGFLSGFDMFVHPSTYSRDDLKKSETFGVSVLEAITAGLPVLATDAGGIPEVIGAEGPQAKIVRHGDAAALADGLVEMITSPASFADNRDYAEERLATFAPERRIRRILDVADTTAPRPLRAALFSTSTVQGAGYAAYRLHRGLLETGVRSEIFTTVRNHESEPGVAVLPHPRGDNRQWQIRQFKPKPGNTIFSLDENHLSSRNLLKLVDRADVINLHWHARFLSTENVAALTHSGKPVVLTIRDMHPLTGGCHFFHGCTRWTQTCRDCPQEIAAYAGSAESVLGRKRTHYDFDNLTIVVLSEHSRRIVEKAPEFSRCRIELIPNSIETDVFRPLDKTLARASLGLPLDRPIVGYVPSFSSNAKGYREITDALNALPGRLPGGDPFVMLLGNRTPATDAIALDKASLGYIHGNERLARAYCAADVIVVPSLEETFSNTTAEALSCGVPVVGFRTGALPDLIRDGQTGFTFPVGDSAGLAEGILQVLVGPAMGPACRAQALRKVAFMAQAHRYTALFTDLVEALALHPRR